MSLEDSVVFSENIKKVYSRYLHLLEQRKHTQQSNTSNLEAEFVIAYIFLFLDAFFPKGKCITGPVPPEGKIDCSPIEDLWNRENHLCIGIFLKK